jgi:hypothetical protein
MVMTALVPSGQAMGKDQRAILIRQQFTTAIGQEVTTKRLIIGGATAGALVILAPAVLVLAKVGMIMTALGVSAVGCGVAYKWLPWIVQRTENAVIEAQNHEANRHLIALKLEAKENPIEQAQNEFMRRSTQYANFKSAMEKIGGKVTSCRTKLQKMAADRPQYDLTEQWKGLEKMETFYNNRIERMKQAYIKLQEFKAKIDEAKEKWEFQLMANDAIAAMNSTDKDALIGEILVEVAFDSVQQEFDAIFAKLDIDAAEVSAQKQLDFGTDMKLDISEIELAEVAHA